VNREEILSAFKDGRIDLEETLSQIDQSYYHDVGHTTLDLDRESRTGAPEVVFGSGKTAEQVMEIVEVLLEKNVNTLVTRLDEEKYSALSASLPEYATYTPNSQLLRIKVKEIELTKSFVAVVSAGTSDHNICGRSGAHSRIFWKRDSSNKRCWRRWVTQATRKNRRNKKGKGYRRSSWHGGGATQCSGGTSQKPRDSSPYQRRLWSLI